MSQYTKCLFGGALLAAGMASPTEASVSFVNSRATLNGNNYVDWGQFGPEFTNVANGSSGLTSPSGVSFKAGGGGYGYLNRRDQGNGWNGNFAYGDRIVWSNYGNGPIRLDFAVPTDRVGANVQAAYFGPFTGYITVFDSNNNPLGTFNAAGYSSSAGDGSAIFMGVQSTGYDISAVEFRSTNDFGVPNWIGINQVDENYVPAPGAAGLLGLSGLIAVRRRRR